MVDGTSIAAAFVSAAAALMFSENNNLAPQEIIEIINSTARRVNTLEDYCKSGGYLDIEACLKGMSSSF